MHDYWTIADWQSAYTKKQFKLTDLIDYVANIDNSNCAWIQLASADLIQAQIDHLLSLTDGQNGSDDLPLYGIPFAVKDNIDVKGFDTTAACPDARYVAQEDAKVIKKLKAAGGIVIGKTNLDQFATGLVGTRSPYGCVQNSFNSDYISGGSSAGSAVSVANGVVPFSLGTDTAGSGRVPAGHNHIVGLKSTKGWFSKTGLIPACQLHDVISIFAQTVDDAWLVASVMEGYDVADSYSRPHPLTAPAQFSKGRIAIPDKLEFYGDKATEKSFNNAIERLKSLNYDVVTIDFTVFNQLAEALYNDSWVAERTVAIERLVTRQQTLPVIEQIINQADDFTAMDAMQAEYTRAALASNINQTLSEFDALMVPTAPTIYTIDDVNADPLTKNSHMGAYTNFVNLADLSALALPNEIAADGLPRGVTFIAAAWHDEALASFGRLWQNTANNCLGTSTIPAANAIAPHAYGFDFSSAIQLAVVGAHLTNMPLNYQITNRGGVLLKKTKTAHGYKLFALAGSQPQKPGLQRHPDGDSIDIEIWLIPIARFGEIVAEVPPPLGIGNLQTVEGDWVKGFICEDYALASATDVTAFKSWKAYIESTQS